ncbi:MAG: outer membrane lipoprotein carrier protein LolA [Thalassobaculaceae bacterium]|nr:outer membrane lipoprotein carrier protein LolA [Thalassobaculaceae bacterium]
MRARLVGAEILRADFRQQKSLPVLSRELTSRGGMILVRGRGILWHILEPFDRFVLVRPDQVTEWEDGAAAAKTTKATGAVMARVIKVILAAISGDIAYLEKYFAIAVEERPAGWHIALTPSATSGRGMFSRIEIEGDRFVETVVVTAAGGDVTTIRLDNFRTEPARLSEREMDYFDQ